MQQGIKFNAGLTQMTRLLLALTWYHTHKQIHIQHTQHTQGPCAPSNYLYYTDIKNLFHQSQQYLCFSIISHLQQSHICLSNLIKFSFFSKTYFTTPSLLMGKIIWTPILGKISKTLYPPRPPVSPFIIKEGFQLWLDCLRTIIFRAKGVLKTMSNLCRW